MWFLLLCSFFLSAQDDSDVSYEDLRNNEVYDQSYDKEELEHLERSAKRMKEARNFYGAIRPLKLIIQMGGHDRYKLDLAATYFQIGRLSCSYALFHQVYEECDLPPSVKSRVKAWLQRLNTLMDRYYAPSYGLNFTLGYDTNINSGPDADRIKILGRLFTLDEDYRQKAGLALSTNFSYFNRIELPCFFDGGAVSASVSYRKVPDFSMIDYYRVRVGYTADKYLGKSTLSIPLSVSYGGEGDEWTTVDYSMGLKYSYPVAQKMVFYPHLSYTYRLDTRDEDKLTGHIWSLGSSFSYVFPFLNNRLSIVPFLYVSGSNANKADYYHYVGAYLGSSLSYAVSQNMRALATFKGELRQYKEIDPLDVDMKRKDVIYTLTVNLKKMLKIKNYVCTPTLSYRYRLNDSNIDRRDYSSHNFSVSVDINF